MPIIAVFDTNVLFSAVGWGGPPLKCLRLAQKGAIQSCTCLEILEELSEKLCIKLDYSRKQAAEVTDKLLAFSIVVPITGKLQVVVDDPDDDKVLECAILAQATHLVTGDRRHLLPLGTYRGIKIMTPAEFLAQ